MPKLQLPKFSGDPTEWTTFWELFSSSIDDSPYFTNIEKFNYLKCNVTDEAKIHRRYSRHHKGYQAAVELLQKCFGQKHRIIEAYMISLLNISKPRQDDVISLRSFYDHLESYIRSLSALGKNTDSYGSLLEPSLLDKMPAEVQMNLARTHGNREWKLDELHKAILTEVEIITSDAGPVAVKSKLGYLTSGPLTSASARAPTSTSTTLLLLNSPRNDNLPDLWSLESLGIKPAADSDND